MDIIDFRDYCLSLGEVEEKMPFGKFAARYDSILVFYVAGHMFCLVDINDFTSVNVKLPPDTVAQLRQERESSSRPINLSEKHWIQLNFGGDISDKEIYDAVRLSFDTVKAQYTPKKPRKQP